MGDHSIDIIAGTDAGVGEGVFDDLVESLGIYEAAGWTTPEVLAMTTTRAAAAIGRADRIGRLRPGFDADLLIAAGRPHYPDTASHTGGPAPQSSQEMRHQ